MSFFLVYYRLFKSLFVLTILKPYNYIVNRLSLAIKIGVREERNYLSCMRCVLVCVSGGCSLAVTAERISSLSIGP